MESTLSFEALSIRNLAMKEILCTQKYEYDERACMHVSMFQASSLGLCII